MEAVIHLTLNNIVPLTIKLRNYRVHKQDWVATARANCGCEGVAGGEGSNGRGKNTGTAGLREIDE